MHVTILRPDLYDGLKAVAGALGRSTTWEALDHILLRAEGDHLKLAATDLELSISVEMGANIAEEGAVALPGKALLDLVRNLPPERIEIAEEGDSARLTCGANTVTFMGISAGDYPDIPGPPPGGTECDAAALRDAAQRAIIATATNGTRPILTGVLVQPEETGEDRTLTFAAADGFQLSVVRHGLNGGAFEAGEGLIVPGHALGQLVRLLAGKEGVVTIASDTYRAIFCIDDLMLAAQLIDGQFPNYHAIIPTAWTTRAIIDRRKLLDACKQIAVFAREANNTMKLTFTPDVEDEIGTVTLYANAGEAGDGTKVIDATVEGNPLEIHFNAAYLIDVLGVMAADYVEMTLQKPENPALIRPYEDEGTFRYVIMPKQG